MNYETNNCLVSLIAKKSCPHPSSYDINGNAERDEETGLMSCPAR